VNNRRNRDREESWVNAQRYLIPTACDMRSRLAGKKIFTVVNMKDAFWHIELSKQSSYYYAFNMP